MDRLSTNELSAPAHKANTQMCMQCHKCTSGCPVANEMTHPPSRIVRLVQLGRKDDVLCSPSIWLCTSCYTCATRCPAGVNPTLLMDSLRRISTIEGRIPSDLRSAHAAEALLRSIERTGRSHELSVVARFKWRTKTFFEMFIMGIAMFFKGKLKLFGKGVHRPKPIAALVRSHVPRRSMKE